MLQPNLKPINGRRGFMKALGTAGATAAFVATASGVRQFTPLSEVRPQ